MNKIFTYNGHVEHSIEFIMSYVGIYFIQQLNHICFDLIINTHCKWTVICYSWYLKSRAYKRPCSNVSFFSYVSLLLKLMSGFMQHLTWIFGKKSRSCRTRNWCLIFYCAIIMCFIIYQLYLELFIRRGLFNYLKQSFIWWLNKFYTMSSNKKHFWLCSLILLFPETAWTKI